MSLNVDDIVTDGTAKFRVVKSATTKDISDAIDDYKEDIGYRQKSTTYSEGDIAYFADLPAGFVLECTTTGTTSNGNLSVAGKTGGDTVMDGTVVWEIKRISTSSADLFEVDINGGLMPSADGVYSDDFELDSNSDIMPKA